MAKKQFPHASEPKSWRPKTCWEVKIPRAFVFSFDSPVGLWLPRWISVKDLNGAFENQQFWWSSEVQSRLKGPMPPPFLFHQKKVSRQNLVPWLNSNCNSCHGFFESSILEKSQVWAHLSTTSMTIMFQKIHEFPGQTNPFLNGWGGWPKCMHVLPNPNGGPACHHVPLTFHCCWVGQAKLCYSHSR